MNERTHVRCYKVHGEKKGGILVSIVDRPSAKTASEQGVRQAYVFIEPNARQLAEIVELADSGKLKAVASWKQCCRWRRPAAQETQSGRPAARQVRA